MIIEIIKFFVYAVTIVIISKFILVKALRGLAENLNLKPRTIGNISGVATSIPEFLTVIISSIKGLANTSIYNILSSNIINFIQYITSIIIHKNQKQLKNKAIIIQLVFVFLTILIPVILLKNEKDITLIMAIIFIILYFIFTWIMKKAHEKYMDKKENWQEYEEIEEEKRKQNKKSYIYVLYIILAGILLYVIGNALGNVLENLAEKFNIAEYILGILLGFITSIPELITFFESQKHYKEKEEKKALGVIEATNNLLTSNMLNLFIIQALGIIVYSLI